MSAADEDERRKLAAAGEEGRADVEGAIRRIVIVLEGEGAEDPTLRALAELAASLQSELAGLFVEDVNLLRLADLPFARQFSRLTSGGRRLAPGEVQREMKVKAMAAQRALAQVAERAGVSWSFRVARGLVAAELLAAAMEADLMALCARERAGTHRHEIFEFVARVGERRGAVRRAPAPPGGPVAVTFGAGAGAERALALAIRLGESLGRGLAVYVVAVGDEAAAKLQARAAAALGERPAEFRRLKRLDLDQLLKAVRAERASALVLEAGERVLEAQAIEALHERPGCPVLLVR